MEWIGTKEVLTEWFKKYRWAALVLLLGVFLLIIPEDKTETSVSLPQIQPQEESLQKELERILSSLEGAGKVQVLLSTSVGEEIHYQTDEDISDSNSGRNQRSQTVRITGSDRNDSGLIRRVDPPRYLGAVILCQGAGSAAVRLAVVDAVKKVTGLTSDRISVLKMK